jgi:DNA-binding MarR family transcriptional regulator
MSTGKPFRQRALYDLLKRGELSRVEIRERLGWDCATVDNIVGEMLRRGTIGRNGVPPHSLYFVRKGIPPPSDGRRGPDVHRITPEGDAKSKPKEMPPYPPPLTWETLFLFALRSK